MIMFTYTVLLIGVRIRLVQTHCARIFVVQLFEISLQIEVFLQLQQTFTY